MVGRKSVWRGGEDLTRLHLFLLQGGDGAAGADVCEDGGADVCEDGGDNECVDGDDADGEEEEKTELWTESYWKDARFTLSLIF